MINHAVRKSGLLRGTKITQKEQAGPIKLSDQAPLRSITMTGGKRDQSTLQKANKINQDHENQGTSTRITTDCMFASNFEAPFGLHRRRRLLLLHVKICNALCVLLCLLLSICTHITLKFVFSPSI